MKKFWAIACVIAFTAFWIFGFLALAAMLGERPFDWTSTIIAMVGLGLGTYARMQINAMTHDIKKGLHVRPTQGEDPYAEQVHS
ncbi:hypothetical protein M8007_01925 [Dinoroseobacter shibae]|nr:hypothetical protein [Dinoroseobacter shibae]URF51396.1 hypothetical protein M8007_01925 [Dinoroseobacter shibae]